MVKMDEASFGGELQKAFEWFKNHKRYFETSKPNRSKITPLRRRWNLETGRSPQFEGASNLHIPILRWMVEALVVRLHTAHFYNPPYVLLRPFHSDKAEYVDQLERLLFAYQFTSKRGDHFYPIIVDGCLLGTGVGYKYWRTEKNRSYPMTEYVPLEDFIIYPAVHNLDEALAVGHTSVWSVRKLEETFKLTDEVRELIWAGMTYAEAPDSDMTPLSGWGYTEVVFLYFWFNGKIYEVVYIERPSYILKFGVYPLPLFPYVLYTVNRRYGLFGEGVGRQLEGLEDEIVEFHNLRIDNLKLTNMPIFKVRKGSTASNIRSFSFGEKIITETPNDIEPLFMPQAFPAMEGEEGMLLEYAKLVSGISELMAGQTGKPYTTAYAIETAILEGSVRFKQIFSVAKNALVRDAHLDLMMIKKWGEDAYETLLIGGAKPTVHFTEESIIDLTDFAIEPNTSSINRETDRQRLLMMRELMANELTEAGRYQLNAAILRNMGFYDIETFLGEKPQEGEEASTMDMPPLPPIGMGSLPFPNELITEGMPL